MGRGPRPGTAPDDGCSILHLDLDAFFASVELARRPQLRGRPVVVGGSHRGVVLAVTSEARTFGVRPAMPMAAALRLCPQAVVIPPDRAAYAEVSAGVMAVLRGATALVEQVSLDEAFLDVSDARRRLGPPTAIAGRIRAQVREGFGLTCSVGIATTRLVARLASGQAGPDGVLLVPRAATADFLRALPAGARRGPGERPEVASPRPDVRTGTDLVGSDRGVPREAPRSAGRLLDVTWGREPRPVDADVGERPVSAEVTFDDDVADLSVVETAARDLSGACAGRLRRLGLVARTVSVTVRASDLRTLTRSRTLTTPTDVGREVFLIARELLAAADLSGLPVRAVGLGLEGLSRASVLVRQPTADDALDEPGLLHRGAERPEGDVRVEARPVTGHSGAQQAGRRDRSTTTILLADLS
jgi:DNA polymerase-4